jgi:hypothetical protein
VGSGGRSCCGTGSQETALNPITANLYSADEAHGLPQEAVLASFGCGNPTALAELLVGETVLDLGSGGGSDVLFLRKSVRTGYDG